MMSAESHSFTTYHDGIARQLRNKVLISRALGPRGRLRRPDPKRAKDFFAIWDTGATNCAVTPRVVDECGLKPIRMVRVYTAGGEDDKNVYLVDIYLPNKLVVTNVHVTECDIRGADVLIGMDIISSGDFAVSNVSGKTTFTFRMPSSKRIDFVKESKAKGPPVRRSNPKTGRNDPCPCGSGKKYKKCCGKKEK